MIQSVEGNRTLLNQANAVPQAFQKLQPTAEVQQEVNFWRDTPVRYVGYADEVGEALEPYIGRKAVIGTYLVSTAYALMDAFTTSRKTYRQAAHKPFLQRWKETLAEVGDAILFHVPATIFVPALLVGKSREAANYIAAKGIETANHHGEKQEWSRVIKKLKKPLDRLVEIVHADPRRSAVLTKRASLLAAIVGIAMIPLVGKPIDKILNYILDKTYRPLVGKTVQSKPLPPLNASPFPQEPSLITPPDTFVTLFN